MTAKVENYCAHKRTRSISVERSEKACINCIWYEQYYRSNRGNVACWVAVNKGNCILKDLEKNPLDKPCKSFEVEE